MDARTNRRVSLVPIPSITKPKTKRLQRESFWIDQLHTAVPNGLNIQYGNQIIPFVTTNNTRAKNQSLIVKRYYKELQDQFTNIYSKRLVTAFKRNKTLSNIRVHGRIESSF